MNASRGLQAMDILCRKGRHTVLQGVSAAFAQGQLHGIIGPNGSGKTSLLKVLAGIWPFSQGSILWQGHSLHTSYAKALPAVITLVPQQQGKPLFPFNVLEFVAMGCYTHLKKHWFSSRDENQYTVVIESLAAVDGLHLAQRTVDTLSAGELQRVYLARSLATEAEIVLLDEPFSHLDIKHQMQIWELLQELVAKKGKTVILSNHDIAMTAKLCHTVTVIHEGRIFDSGNFNALLQRGMLTKVFGIDSQKYLYSVGD